MMYNVVVIIVLTAQVLKVLPTIYCRTIHCKIFYFKWTIQIVCCVPSFFLLWCEFGKFVELK